MSIACRGTVHDLSLLFSVPYRYATRRYIYDLLSCLSRECTCALLLLLFQLPVHGSRLLSMVLVEVFCLLIFALHNSVR